MSFVTKSRKFHYTFSSQTVINGILGILIKLGMLKTSFFIARESTHIFRRFSGLKLSKYRLFYLLGYSSVDLLICQTELMRLEFIRNLPGFEKNVNIKSIPNPIDIEEGLKSDSDFEFNKIFNLRNCTFFNHILRSQRYPV